MQGKDSYPGLLIQSTADSSMEGNGNRELFFMSFTLDLGVGGVSSKLGRGTRKEDGRVPRIS